MLMQKMQHVGVMPSTGRFQDTAVGGGLLKKLSMDWGGGAVFSTDYDRYATECQNWINQVVEPHAAADRVVENVMQTFGPPEADQRIFPIVSPEGLENVPPDMWVPILTEPTIRELFEHDQIQGFGLPKEALPKEDVAGRITERNGYVEFDMSKPNEDDIMTWTVKSTDPEWTPDEQDAIRETRMWIRDSFLAEQMDEDGERIDPTSYPLGRIGSLR